MKKLFKLTASILALIAGLFATSCASTGTAKNGTGFTPVHPREYTLDLSESKTGTKINVTYNQYGPNYQSDLPPNFTGNVKKDKPQAGDTIHVYYKFSTDIDIPRVKFSLIDPTVNYWLELAQDDTIMIDDVKAGEIYEGNKDIVLQNDVQGEFKAYIAYDNSEFLAEGLPAVGAPAVFTFYDVEGVTSTDVALELPASEQQTGPKTINIEINKIAAFCNVVTGHPWVNGQQIMSEIENYQADISYRSLLEDEPQVGDILVVTWKGRPDIDIPALKIMPVDHSKEVDWWRIMIDDTSDENVTVATNLKAGEVFEITKTFVIDTAAVTTDCNLRVWYEYDPETDGPGPCNIIGVNK